MALVVFVTLLQHGNAANRPPALNKSKVYSMRITKYLCVGTPYERSILNYCRTILRRNKPTLMNMSIYVPEVLTYVWNKVKLYYKYRTFQPFLIDLELEGCEYLRNRPPTPLSDYVYSIFEKLVPEVVSPCPHGNRTYNLVWWLEEEHFPKSLPAGDYRLDAQFIAHDQVVVFAVEAYFSVRRSGVLGSMLEW